MQAFNFMDLIRGGLLDSHEDEVVKAIITPTDAQWIQDNCDKENRCVKQVVVDNYAKQMGNGDWKFNGDTITFNTDKILTNGHHRILACIKSGVPFTTYVVFGLENSNEVKMSQDQGSNKTCSDFISYKHLDKGFSESYRKKISIAISNVIAPCVALEKIGNLVYSKKRVDGGSMSKKVTYFDTNADKVTKFAKSWIVWENTPTMKSGIFPRKAFFGGMLLFLYIHCEDWNNIKTFMDTLLGANYGRNSVTLYLREYLSKNVGKKFTPNEISNIYIMSWNAYVLGKPLTFTKGKLKENVSITLTIPTQVHSF